MTGKIARLDRAKSWFPEDILDEILLKLPIKYLIQCSLVCKSWNSLLKSPTFILAHRDLRRTIKFNSQSGLHFHFRTDFCTGHGQLFKLHWDNPRLDQCTKFLSSLGKAHEQNRPTFYRYADGTLVENFDVVGMCDGLVCLVGKYSRPWASTIIIWNPSIRKFVKLPRARVALEYQKKAAKYAFGYDSSSDDYKVLRVVIDRSRRAPCEVQVYSFAKGSWKSLSETVIPTDFMPDADHDFNPQSHVNGAMHWINQPGKDGFDIFSFDMATELFGKITVPDDFPREDGCYTSTVFKYEEQSLALCCMNFEDARNEVYCLQMWVMKEYGVRESWTKLPTICLNLMDLYKFTVNPLATDSFVMIGKVLITKSSRDCDKMKLILVNRKNKQVEHLIDGYMMYFMDSFVESLVLLAQPNAISS